MSSPDTVETQPEADTDLDAVDSLEGSVIDERYEVGPELGSGGFGVVHLARQIALDRRVAVKALHASVAADATNLRRFFVEARAASSIQHPNIVEVIDFGELPSGVPYLVMEHLEGRDLGRVLRDTGPMRWSRARGILLQILAALKAAHAAGILHRDIKTSNVIVRESDGPLRVDFVKLVDFGVAKFVDEKRAEDRITAVAVVIGTAAYLAPELRRAWSPTRVPRSTRWACWRSRS
jgi:serine/threonine protein kinase